MLTEGWGKLANATKWHYFDADHKALCKKWMALGSLSTELGNDDSPDNCLACKRALKQRAPVARREPPPSPTAHPVRPYSCPVCKSGDLHNYLRCQRPDCTDGRDPR